MKKFFTFITIVFASFASNAQQDVKFNHFMFNRLFFNPGAVGNQDNISVSGIFRNQWVGFDGAPTSNLFTISSPIKLLHGGLGLTLIDDELGGLKTTNINLQYAYHTNFQGGKLGLGINAGIFQRTFNPQNLNPINPIDPLIPSANISGSNIDLGIGAFYTKDDYYIGLSATHLNGASLNDPTSSVELKLRPHIYLTGGYTLDINDNFDVTPALLVKSDLIKTQFDINANLRYKELYWAGLTYTSQDAIVALVGAKIPVKNTFLNVGYSYDFTTSQLANYSSGTHEIFVSYNFEIKRKPKPRIIIKDPRRL